MKHNIHVVPLMLVFPFKPEGLKPRQISDRTVAQNQLSGAGGFKRLDPVYLSVHVLFLIKPALTGADGLAVNLEHRSVLVNSIHGY